jgi:hypothetical protein
MIVLEYKVCYICANPSCRLPIVVSKFSLDNSRDVTGIWMDIDRMKNCYACNWPMEIKRVECRVSTDMFGTDLEGVWSCDDHPYNMFYPIPLRNTYYMFYPMPLRKIYYMDVVGNHIFPLYKEIAKLGFPWKCPTCKEPMKYEEKRAFTVVG